MPRHPWRPLFPPPTWFMTSLALHTRTWIIWHEEERHTLRRPSWPGLATVLDHWREPKVKHQDLRAMACECKGCLVDGCRGSASRSCGWPLANKKRAIMRCHLCTVDEEKIADREPGIADRKQPQHATEQLTTTSQTQMTTTVRLGTNAGVRSKQRSERQEPRRERRETCARLHTPDEARQANEDLARREEHFEFRKRLFMLETVCHEKAFTKAAEARRNTQRKAAQRQRADHNDSKSSSSYSYSYDNDSSSSSSYSYSYEYVEEEDR